MDALADILEAVHLSGTVFCRSELSAPWGMSVPAGTTAQFHVLRRGRCWLRLEDHESDPVLLEVGDVVILPQGHAHVLADDLATPAQPLKSLLSCHLPADGKGPLQYGGGGLPVTLICGTFEFATGAVHPLLSVLPPLVLVRGEGRHARSWMETTLDLIAFENQAGRPGGETLVKRLTEALFVQVLRAYLEEEANAAPSWLAGLRDAKIAEVLALMHREPGVRWSVETLAARVGMSRSSFSARFGELVGEPPLSYLTRWRMHLAADHLRQTRLSLPEIASAVGYQAEASFSKVFKRMWGVAPASFRRQPQRQRGPGTIADPGAIR